MPRRRPSVAPQTEIQVLRDRIIAVEKQLKALRQPGMSSLQADDYLQEPNPAPWQTMINHPGGHTPATPLDPFVYYHPGEPQVGGVEAGFKAVGSKPIPWIRMRKTTTQSIAWGGDSVITFDDYVMSAEGASFFEVVNNNLVRVLVDGAYLMGAQMHWGSVFSEPHLISISDGYLFNTGFTYEDANAFELANQGMMHMHRYNANKLLTLLAAVGGTTNRDITLGYFEVWYMGAYTGLSPDDETE